MDSFLRKNMIKKITIKDDYKTISANFSLELGRITVITGGNNSGKTNFIKTIAGDAKTGKGKTKKDVEVEFFDENNNLIKPRIIYISAENIKPSDNESNSSAKTSNLIKRLSGLFVDVELKPTIEKPDRIFELLKKLEEKTNTNIREFTGNEEHRLNLLPNEEELDSNILIQALIKKVLGEENKEEREFDDLGQGTQRIIVASILKAYADILVERKKEPERPILILFEEPEIYLHPKLKKSLNGTFRNIVENTPNHQIVLTTHDPYFSYTNLDGLENIVYSFKKDSGKTDKEVPNTIFGIEDELLHIHLFEKIIRKALSEKIIGLKYTMDQDGPLNKWLMQYCNGETRDNTFPSGVTHNLALPLHVRHVIHHPLDTKNKFNEEDLEKSIKILNRILS